MRGMIDAMSLPIAPGLAGAARRAHLAKPTGTTKTVTKTV
jgi:hypothetical protein